MRTLEASTVDSRQSSPLHSNFTLKNEKYINRKENKNKEEEKKREAATESKYPMATPLNVEGVMALMPQEPLNPMDPSSSSAAASSPSPSADKMSFVDNPILIFLFFQKAIRLELDRLHRAAEALATGSGGDLRSLSDRWVFISDIYRHHCNAEDEVGWGFFLL